MAEYRHLLDYIVVEYVALMDILTQKRPVKSGGLLIDRQELTKAFDKNKYLPSSEKLRIYKQFNMLTATAEGVSRVVYDKENKKPIRKIALNVDTYIRMKKLLNAIK